MKSVDITAAPYPVSFAFHGAVNVAHLPLISMINRMLVGQYDDSDGAAAAHPPNRLPTAAAAGRTDPPLKPGGFNPDVRPPGVQRARASRQAVAVSGS